VSAHDLVDLEHRMRAWEEQERRSHIFSPLL
jgi:hypothetical protein